MPYSQSTFDSRVEELITRIRPATVLDVGSGAGKYGIITRRANPSAHIISVDTEDYRSQFHIHKIYDECYVTDAMSFVENHLDRMFDLSIIGDVIEHLTKSRGLDLLHYLSYMSRHIVVIFPDGYRQGALEGKESERHRSRWHESDFVFIEKREFVSEGFMRYVHLEPSFVNVP